MKKRINAPYWLGLVGFLSSFILQSIAPFALATSVSVGLLETPASIVVTPATATVDPDDSQQFTAVATFTSGSPDLDVTTDPLTEWVSESAGVASVNATGEATGIDPGSSIIRATYGGKSGTATLTVNDTTPPEEEEEGGSAGGSSGGSEPSSGEEGGETPAPDEGETTPTPDEGEPGPVQEEGEQPAPPAPGEEPAPNELPSPPVTPPSETAPETAPDASPETTPSVEETERDFQFVSPAVSEEGEYQYQIAEVFLPDELSVTRGETLRYMIDQFTLEDTYKELLDSCFADMDSCLSIFLSASSFDGIVIDSPGDVSVHPGSIASMKSFLWTDAFAQNRFAFGNTQLYPDVPPDDPYSYEINLSTLLSIVQGYYEEPGSPFKPFQVISRMEAVKVILGSIDIMEWMYYPELETILGGPEGIKSQKTPFSDVNSTRDYMWWYPRYLNTACELDMIDCKEGSNFRPDEYITEAEFNVMIDRLRASL
ncbi:MAG TPA: Ig-like domain-containing protein, partial [Candidatus Gracilibacteria bacterium]|nr:Ig-like domain-containing protein [Candidatus Gracilibacteria bacterium]